MLEASARPGSLTRVRLTAFWERMRAQFGETYAESVAKDHVLALLGGRTVNEALADGEDVKVVWGAGCADGCGGTAECWPGRCGSTFGRPFDAVAGRFRPQRRVVFMIEQLFVRVALLAVPSRPSGGRAA